MEAVCTVCGTSFHAQRVTAKYCGSTCRTRASRAGTSTPRASAESPGRVTPLPTAVPDSRPDDEAPALEGVHATTVAELQAAGRLYTPLGQGAVTLARRIDNSYKDTGSALASMVRQWQATLAAATAGVKTAASPLDQARDELARRRARRGA